MRAPAGAAGVRPVGIGTLVRGVGASRGVITALVMMVLVAIVSGTLDTLVPLRLGSDGYSAAAITLVLSAAGVLATAATYGTGRIFDRFGGIPIAVTSIVAMAAFVVALAAARSGLQLAVVFVAATLPITGQYAVAYPLCAEGADSAGLGHANVFGLLNVAWGSGIPHRPGGGRGARPGDLRPDHIPRPGGAVAGGGAALRPLALSYKECQPSRLNAG